MDPAKSAEEAPLAPPSPHPRPSHPSYPPFHIVPGVSNFRDIGGWPIPVPGGTQTKHVRQGLIFRGGDTTRISPAGIDKLTNLNVRKDFDLRSKQQMEKTGGLKDLSEWGIETISNPVFREEEYTKAKAEERYAMYASENPADIVKAFVEILESGSSTLREVIHQLFLLNKVSGPPQALFLHCTTGNNRTGVFIAMLLSLLRVPSSFIVREYKLSEFGLAPTKHINVERLLKNGAFKEDGEVEARSKCERMLSAREQSMQALLAEIEKREGGVEGYFMVDVGLTPDEISQIREILTADGDSSLDDERERDKDVIAPSWLKIGNMG
ncbi:protein-tyrosine phosphatase-like protein [Phaeosphaeriaceae sp. PMI808]|nr:protein-tyrosine phosphatase-like protein [Phaeosphaeriaceae sp. PMI808]